MTKTTKFRPVYPSSEEVEDILTKIRNKTATAADLSRAVTMLRKAGLRVDDLEEVQA